MPPTWIPQLADAAEVVAARRRARRVREPSPSCRTCAGSSARSTRVCARSPSWSARPSRSRRRTSTPRVTVALERALSRHRRRRAAAGHPRCAATSRWRSATRGRGPVDDADRRRPVRAARTPPAAGRSPSATRSASRPPGPRSRGSSAESSSAGVPVETLALHLHDTYGQALANVLAASADGRRRVRRIRRRARPLPLRERARRVTSRRRTSSGCSHGLGIETGLDSAPSPRRRGWLADIRGVPAPSRVARALAAAADESADDRPTPRPHTQEATRT